MAKVWSDENDAVAVALYVSPGMPKERAEQYGEGLMRIYKRNKIPANYYIQRIGDSTASIGTMNFFVHGYFFGTYAGKDVAAGLKLSIDGFNGEEYVRQMLEDGEL